MTLEQYARDAVAAVEAADKKALASRLAFAAGKFPEYWEQQGREAQARIEAMYAAANADTSGTNGGAGGGVAASPDSGG